MRKANSLSVLKTLPSERQDAIAEHLAGHSLVDTAAWLKADGIKTSRSSLSEFGSWYALRQQLTHNASTVETLLEELKRGNPSMTHEQMDEAGQLFFTTLAIEQRDSLTWKRVQSDKRAAFRDQLESRRIAVLEKKAAQLDQVQKVVAQQLSPEEQKARLKEILK